MQFVIKLFLNSLAVIIASQILPGVHVNNWLDAILLAAVLAVLNVSIKPIIIFFTLPFTLISLGLFLLVINACIILIADWILGTGFNVDGFWWALAFSIILSILNSMFERLVIKNKPLQNENKDGEMQIFDKDGNRIV